MIMWWALPWIAFECWLEALAACQLPDSTKVVFTAEIIPFPTRKG